MANAARVSELMVEVGALLDLDQVTELPDQAYWYLMLPDETVIDAEYEAESDRVVLSTPIGRPQPGSREAVYDTLLAYNAAWRETGGVRAALDEPGGELLLLCDVTVHGLAASELQAVVGGLAQLAQTWRAYVAKRSTGSPEGTPLAHAMGAIRA
jgi:hypothetical protein